MKSWYYELKTMQSSLRAMSGEHLTDNDLQRLGIEVSDFDLHPLEINTCPDPTARNIFFKPFPRRDFTVSSCDCFDDPSEHENVPEPAKRKVFGGDYYLGRRLEEIMQRHLKAVRDEYPTKWTFIG